MRLAVVVNPLAGGRHTGRFDRTNVEHLVSQTAAEAGADALVLVTTGAGGGRESTRRALEAGADRVVAWGGDGTVNEVASVLVGTRVPLAIVPVGSGNGLARGLGVPLRPRDALRLAVTAPTRTIDVGRIEERVFVNVAGVGFDAAIAKLFNAGGPRRGFARYVGLVFRELARYQPRNYQLVWPGGRFDGPAGIIAFANSRQYGNGAKIAPRAELDDGRLDVVIVGASSTLGDLWRARRLFTGTLHEDPLVQTVRVEEATIAASEPMDYHVDGEPVRGERNLAVVVLPGALEVCASRESP